jgi:hypothetical protein
MIFHASKRGAGPGLCATAAIARAIGANAKKQCNLKPGLTFATIFLFRSYNSPVCSALSSSKCDEMWSSLIRGGL